MRQALSRWIPGWGHRAFAHDAETRSDTTELGDLTSGRLHLIVGDTASGQPVTENTATGVPAVVACVNLKAEMIAKLPIHLFRDGDGDRVPTEIRNHPALDVIRRPSDMHTEFELRKLMQIGEGFGGNGYAQVFRNEYGEPRAMQWLKPSDVKPIEVPRPNGERFVAYKVKGVEKTLTRYDVAHVMGMSRDGVKGESPVKMLRESIGTSVAQTKAAGKLMQNGAKWPGFMSVEGVNDPQKLAAIRDEINANMAGVLNAGRIPVVGGSLTWQQTNGMSMSDAEFIESRKFELQEIARLYRVPAFMIGDSTASTTWGTGIEQQTLGFLNYCLDPHLVAWEQSLAMTLLTTDELKAGYFFKFDRDELLNASLQARSAFLKDMVSIGVFSPNDARAKLNEPMIPADKGGDTYGNPFTTSGSTPSQQPEPSLNNGE